MASSSPTMDSSGAPRALVPARRRPSATVEPRLPPYLLPARGGCLPVVLLEQELTREHRCLPSSPTATSPDPAVCCHLRAVPIPGVVHTQASRHGRPKLPVSAPLELHPRSARRPARLDAPRSDPAVSGRQILPRRPTGVPPRRPLLLLLQIERRRPLLSLHRAERLRSSRAVDPRPCRPSAHLLQPPSRLGRSPWVSSPDPVLPWPDLRFGPAPVFFPLRIS
ncbi:hypothetical protein ACQJBY_008476 [Aegilops geniculata]